MPLLTASELGSRVRMATEAPGAKVMVPEVAPKLVAPRWL